MVTSRNFDLHPDGKRFAVLRKPTENSTTKLDEVVFIQNFFSELRRVTPAGR